MKQFAAIFCLFAGLLPAQAPRPGQPADLLATVNGEQLTIEKFESFLNGLPPQMKLNFENNKREFLNQYALMMRLAAMAADKKLEQRSPYKEQLEWARTQVLMQAVISDYSDSLKISQEDSKAFYDANGERWTRAVVKAIYIPFGQSAQQPGSLPAQPLTEAEALAKIESIRKQLGKGADFVQLVREHSRDPESVANNGDFGAISRADNIPDTMKKALFSLQPGQVSEPVRQSGGYYLFRLERFDARPFEEVRGDISNELKEVRFKEWFEKVRSSVEIRLHDQEYFSPRD